MIDSDGVAGGLAHPGASERVALALSGVTKAFEGQLALADLDLELRAGEIHALLGQNGSGKSTLIKLLAGYHQPTSVTHATVQGQPFDLGSAVAAKSAGLHFIHQDLGIVGEMSTVENLALGQPYASRWWVSDRHERAAARELCDRYGVDVDVNAPLATLSPSQQTMIAVVRAMRQGISDRMVLVLDEPTAALPEHEVQHLFALLEKVRARGATVLYVTHRLAEVFEISDRVSVLRDGRRVATKSTSELDRESLLQLIVGRPLESLYIEPPEPTEDVALKVQGLSGRRVLDASFAVQRGQIVGVTGLLGSGYEDVLGLIFDGSARSGGTVSLQGEEACTDCPQRSIRSGLGYVPADRKRLAGVLPWTLRENLTLPSARGSGPIRWLGAGRERQETTAWLQRLQVVPAEPERLFSALSGGNQQKLVLARWLRMGVDVYLLEEPTNGIDVGAKHAIYRALGDACAEGAAVLMSSSDLEELASVCDRVLVMGDGVVEAVLEGDRLTIDNIQIECALDRSVAPAQEGMAH